MLPKKLGEGATPHAWYFIFLSVNLNLLRKKWDPPLPPMLRAFVRTMNHIVNIYQHCPAVTYLIKVFCFTEWLHDKKYTYKRMLRSILFPRDTTGIFFAGGDWGEGGLGSRGPWPTFVTFTIWNSSKKRRGRRIPLIPRFIDPQMKCMHVRQTL